MMDYKKISDQVCKIIEKNHIQLYTATQPRPEGMVSRPFRPVDTSPIFIDYLGIIQPNEVNEKTILRILSIGEKNDNV